MFCTTILLKWGLKGPNFMKMKVLVETPANCSCTLLTFYKYCRYSKRKKLQWKCCFRKNRVQASWCEGSRAQIHVHVCSHTVSMPLTVGVRERVQVVVFVSRTGEPRVIEVSLHMLPVRLANMSRWHFSMFDVPASPKAPKNTHANRVWSWASFALTSELAQDENGLLPSWASSCSVAAQRTVN